MSRILAKRGGSEAPTNTYCGAGSCFFKMCSKVPSCGANKQTTQERITVMQKKKGISVTGTHDLDQELGHTSSPKPSRTMLSASSKITCCTWDKKMSPEFSNVSNRPGFAYTISTPVASFRRCLLSFCPPTSKAERKCSLLASVFPTE